MKRNARSGACKRLGVGVEAKEPILALRSHAASRQGAARTPSGSQAQDGQRSTSARTRRTLARECDNGLDLFTGRQTSTNFNPTGVPFGSESSTNHLVSQQKRTRRREAHGVGPARAGRLRNDVFFHAPFLIGYPRDFASTRLASAASTAKAEGLWRSGCGSPRRGIRIWLSILASWLSAVGWWA